LLIIWMKNKTKYLAIIIAIVAASMAGFKIYTGIFAYIGFGSLALYYLIKNKNLTGIFLALLTALLVLVVYLPANSNSGGFYFTGLWRFENFIVQPYLQLDRLEQARVIFAGDHKWIRVIPYELMFVCIYMIGTFGTKLIGLFQTKKSLAKFPIELHIFFLPALLMSLLLGIFFQQTIGTSNTFNFLVCVFILLTYYTALTCDELLKNFKPIPLVIASLLIILITIPRSINKLSNNISRLIQNKSTMYLNHDLLKAFQYIRKNTKPNSLLAVDFNRFDFDLYSTTVNAMTLRSTYLSGPEMIKQFQINMPLQLKRNLDVKSVFYSLNYLRVGNILINSDIDYELMSTPAMFESTASARFYDVVFSNPTITVAKINKDFLHKFMEEENRKLKIKI
jgi:hypothetical protein